MLSSTLLASFLLLSANAVVGAPLQGSTVTDTLANNFTLAALNTTLPNANTTGAPLVLGSAGAVDGASFSASVTWFSYPFNDWPSLGLVGGNLRAFDAQGNWNTNATVLPPSTGEQIIDWVHSTISQGPASTAFSAVTDSSSTFPTLAVNGVSDLWFLCESDVHSQNRVYFNTTSVTSAKGTDVPCYSVTLNMVPV